jgi:hypothetical protein
MPPLWQYFALSQKSRVRPASDHVGEVRVAELHAKGVNGTPAPFGGLRRAREEDQQRSARCGGDVERGAASRSWPCRPWRTRY